MRLSVHAVSPLSLARAKLGKETCGIQPFERKRDSIWDGVAVSEKALA